MEENSGLLTGLMGDMGGGSSEGMPDMFAMYAGNITEKFKSMTNDEIIAAVNNCPDMRIMNMESTQRIEENPQDKLVVVNFPLNKEYGCCKDRKSDVTIVAPAAVSEMGTGSFAYSLAAMGGFNYVSKELTPNPDDPFGFYTMKKSNLALIGDYDTKENVESQALHFMDDLKSLQLNSEKNGRRHWYKTAGTLWVFHL